MALSSSSVDAIVVGSGPNGLAAAIAIARAGRGVRVLEAENTIGGGARSAELTLPGFVHDLGSAIHPMAAGSPFFRTLPLDRHGLEWIQPEVAVAHPFDDGSAAALYPDLERTCHGLGRDGDAYGRLMRPFVEHWDALAGEFLQPMLHVPRHPFVLGNFGLSAIQPATGMSEVAGSAVRCARRSSRRALCSRGGQITATASGERPCMPWPRRAANALARSLRWNRPSGVERPISNTTVDAAATGPDAVSSCSRPTSAITVPRHEFAAAATAGHWRAISAKSSVRMSVAGITGTPRLV